MKKFIGLLITALISVTAKATETTPVITLTERNTLVIRNVINSQSVASLQDKANKLSQGLSKNEKIYLFLDTPGGSVQSGNEMVSTLRGLPQRVDTITNFAASMGFITVQSLGTRYILPNGILMSHRAAGGAEGQIPGELNTRVNFFTDMLDAQDAEIAKRVNMSKKDYQKLIVNEHWVFGSKAVSTKMADKVVLARCNKVLSEGRVNETVYTFFGPVQLVYSACPLITAPLEINFDQLTLNAYNDVDRVTLKEVRRTILTLVYDKRAFYHDYILNNKNSKKVLP
jgi:ATP-dependent protease ClpP protease subunit